MSSAAAGLVPSPFTSPIMTRNGACRRDSRALLEKFILEGFQSGLSWITILRKRDHFRESSTASIAEKIAS